MKWLQKPPEETSEPKGFFSLAAKGAPAKTAANGPDGDVKRNREKQGNDKEKGVWAGYFFPSLCTPLHYSRATSAEKPATPT
jgi:hypothetical protein